MNEQLPQSQLSTQTLLEQLIEPQPVVIGLEGGPCSGKTTLIHELEGRAEGLGRTVVALPEAATIHIEALMAEGRTMPDIIVNDRPRFLRLQKDILNTVTSNIADAKERHAGTDAIIIIDRPDVGGYITPDEYRQALRDEGYGMPPVMSMVDRLVFLPSVASETPERYAELRLTNNARYETSAEDAAAVCAANLRAVQTHPELQVAWGGSFQEKIRRLAATILQPEIEGEIKQGVLPDEAERFVANAARRGNLLNTMAIEQSYHRLGAHEFRLRTSTGDDGHLHRYLTLKYGEGAFRQEIQRTLNADQYVQLAKVERIGRVLKKLRHVVLDEPGTDGQRRLWYADRYIEPELGEWHLETEVETDAEVEELTAAYAGTRRRVTESAKVLIFK